MKFADIEIIKIPAVPSVLVDLIEACSDADTSFDALGRIIQQDAALAARMVAVCNSAAYAQLNGTRNFNQLLVLLGLNAIKTIAVTTAVRQFFAQFSVDGGKGLGRLWRQSLSCAFTARSLAGLTGYQPTEDAYLGGLLHNLGQLVFLQEFGERYITVIDNAGSLGALTEQELQSFGAVTPKIGAQLVREWFPSSFLADAILYQREDSDRVEDSPQLIKLLNLACRLSWETAPSRLQEPLLDDLFGLNTGVLDDLMERVRSEVREVVQTYGFGSEPDPAVDDELARQALAKRVRDQALVGALGSVASETLPAWDQLLRNFALLSGAPVVAGFEYEAAGNILIACQAIGLSGQGPDLASLELPLKPNRNLLAQACLGKHMLSSLDDPLPDLASVTDAQIRQVFRQPELLALPLVTEQGELLGGLLVGMTADQLRAVLRQRGLLKYYLQAAIHLLKQQRAQFNQKAEMLKAQAEDFHSQSRRMIHEANNPLSVIRNYLHILAAKLDKEHEAQEQIGIIKDEIDRVSDILMRMRDIGSEPDTDASEVNINSLLQDLIGLFRKSLFATAEVNCDLQLDERLPLISTNRNSIKQIITNLLKNAVEALDSRGTVHVETHDQVNFNGTDYVQIIVADNGPGITGEVMAKIFTPVESTKGRGHSGLGLTIVKNLLTELGGNISVRSGPNEGTRFEILLPRKQSNTDG
jgi:signal transduction histidine kinase/HD-like signal output (HDOD) protein